MICSPFLQHTPLNVLVGLARGATWIPTLFFVDKLMAELVYLTWEQFPLSLWHNLIYPSNDLCIPSCFLIPLIPSMLFRKPLPFLTLWFLQNPYSKRNFVWKCGRHLLHRKPKFDMPRGSTRGYNPNSTLNFSEVLFFSVGACSSASYDVATNTCLASFRSSPSYSKPCHTVSYNVTTYSGTNDFIIFTGIQASGVRLHQRNSDSP